MKKSGFILVLLVAYLIALVIQTPARCLNVLLDHYLGQKVMLAQSEGSLWHGGAHVTINDLQNHRSIDLGKIAWNVQILQILTGKLALNMTWNEGSPFWITIDVSRFHIEHAAFNVPGQVAQFLVPSAAAAELGGQIGIHAENFSLTKTQILGSFEVNWDSVTSPLSNLNPLGNYMASFEGAGDVIRVTLKTQSNGPLILQGSGQGGVNQPFQFDGNANAITDKQGQLQQVLQLIGNETSNGSGVYKIKI